MRKRLRSLRPAGIRKTLAKKFEAIRGFTLVELIVVITILAILATVGFLSLSGYSDDARSSVAKANVRMVYSAIATESATTGNSPRYYVSHDPAAALSGTVTVGGVSVTLSGGEWNLPGTNYSAGNPRWDLLRLNPDKFRISAGFRALAEPALAAYDSGSVTVGAVDVPGQPTLGGRKRVVPAFQVAAVSKTKSVATMGNYAPASGTDLRGLVRDPAWSVATALVDGVDAGQDAACLAYSWSVTYSAGQCFSAGGTVVNVLGTGYGEARSKSDTACDTNDVAVFSGSKVQIWAACNVGAKYAWAWSGSDVPSPPTNQLAADRIGSYFQFGNNANVVNAPTTSNGIACDSVTAPSTFNNPVLVTYLNYCASGSSTNFWGTTTNTFQAMIGPCPIGYHVPKYTDWQSAVGVLGASNIKTVMKLPASGARSYVGSFFNVQTDGMFATVDQRLIFRTSDATVPSYGNENSVPIRCLKN